MFAAVVFILASCTHEKAAFSDELSAEERCRILETASLYEGIPYKWGGQSFWYEDDPGVDCSGYVINVYKEVLAGSERRLLFGDAAVDGIWSRYSEHIDAPEMGDLIFFSDGESSIPSHIGIFDRKEGSSVFFWDASSLPDTMCVMHRSYEESNPKILGYGRMLLGRR